MAINDINKSKGFPAVGPLPPTAPVAAFSLEQTNNLLRTKGILGFHIRHAIDVDKETRIAGLNVANENKEHAYIYYDIRPIRVIPQDMSVRDTLTAISLYSTGSTILNVDGNYLDGSKSRVFLRPFDLILLNPTITELYTESFEFKEESQTRLHYRIVEIDFIATGNWMGGQGIRYSQDSDFTITEDGNLKWLPGGNKPLPGQMVSIVYYHRPIFIVKYTPHSLRVLPANLAGSGALPREAKYFPQLIILDKSIVREGSESTTDWFNMPELLDYQKWLDVK